MKVSNGKCVRRLAWQSLAANRTRNLIAVLAIALTAVLFTSLFTIALSINEGIQPVQLPPGRGLLPRRVQVPDGGAVQRIEG